MTSRPGLSRGLLCALVLAAGAASLWFGLGMHRGILLSCDNRAVMWPWRPLVPPGEPQAILLTDPDLQFVPWLRFARAELTAGRLPLWNPHQDGGVPLLANGQSALASPLVWPVLALGPEHGWNLSLLFRLLLAGAGTLLWLRSLGRSPPAACLGAVMFAVSGPFVAWLGHPHTLTAAAAPLLLFAIERARTTGTGRAHAGVAAATLLVLAGGHLETALMVALLAAAATFAPGAPRGRVAGLVAHAVIGALLAAPMLLPHLEYLLGSAAWQGTGRHPFTLPPQALLRFLFPASGPGHPIEGAATVSLVGLGLALPGLVLLWRRGLGLWIAGALAILAVVYANPVSAWLAAHTPVYWSRALLVLPLPLALAAATALDALVGLGAIRRRALLARSILLLPPILAFVELTAAARGVHAVSDPTLLEASAPILDFVRGDPDLFRVLPLGPFLSPNLATVEGLEDVRGYDALAPAGWRLRREAIGRPRQEEINFDDLSPGGEALSFWNVKYLLASPLHGASAARASAELDLELAEVYRGVDGIVLANPGALPRVRLDGPGEARVVARTPARWEIAVATPATAGLTVANPYFPGWEALVDGETLPLRISPGDPFTLAVPAGEHRVVLRYRPLSLRLGAGLAAVGLVLLVWCLARRPGARGLASASTPRNAPR